MPQSALFSVLSIAPSAQSFTNCSVVFPNSFNIKGSPIPQPLEIFPENLSIREHRNALVAIGDRVFYNSVDVVLNADTVTTLVGDSLSIITHRHSKSFNIKYKSSDKLRQRTIDSEFMLSYIKAGAFSYDRISIPFDRKGANFSDYSVEAEENDLQYLKKVVQLLNLFNCKKDIDLKSLTGKDWNNIDFLLELIKAYDLQNNPEIIRTASEFSDWIMGATEAELPYKIRLLNKLQIVKRQRSFNSEERKLLYNLIFDPTSPDDILTAAYLLLGEQSLAKDHFEKLDKQVQQEFKTYPIYHFWQDNITE